VHSLCCYNCIYLSSAAPGKKLNNIGFNPIARWNGFYAYEGNTDNTKEATDPSSKEVKQDFVNFVLKMNESQQFNPSETSSWAIFLQKNTHVSQKDINEVAEDLCNTWHENNKVDASCEWGIDESNDSSILPASVGALPVESDSMSVASSDSFNSVFYNMTPLENGCNKLVCSKYEEPLVTFKPNVCISISALLLAIKSTIPFVPSQQWFWLKVVKKLCNPETDLLTLNQLAAKLQCMWVFSKEGISSVFDLNSQSLFHSYLDCDDQTMGEGSSTYSCNSSHNFSLNKNEWFDLNHCLGSGVNELCHTKISFLVLKKLETLNFPCVFQMESYQIFPANVSNIFLSCIGGCKNSHCSVKFAVDIRRDSTGDVYFIYGDSLCAMMSQQHKYPVANVQLKTSSGFCDFTLNVLKPLQSRNYMPCDYNKLCVIGNDSEVKKFLFDKHVLKRIIDSYSKFGKVGCSSWKRYLQRVLKSYHPFCCFKFTRQWIAHGAYSRYVFICCGDCKENDCALHFEVKTLNNLCLLSTVTFHNVSRSSCKFAGLN